MTVFGKTLPLDGAIRRTLTARMPSVVVTAVGTWGLHQLPFNQRAGAGEHPEGFREVLGAELHPDRMLHRPTIGRAVLQPGPQAPAVRIAPLQVPGGGLPDAQRPVGLVKGLLDHQLSPRFRGGLGLFDFPHKGNKGRCWRAGLQPALGALNPLADEGVANSCELSRYGWREAAADGAEDGLSHRWLEVQGPPARALAVWVLHGVPPATRS